MKELLRRIWYLCNRRRLEHEMAEEMAYHRELMSSDGRADFGSDLRHREVAREIWGWAWLDRLRQDLSYGARVLRNAPGFTATAMLVLALGIGVPLTAFRQVLSDLHGAAPPDAAHVVHLTRRAPGVHITSVPFPEFEFYAANSHSFRNVMGVSGHNLAIFGDNPPGAAPEQVRLAFATANYFPEYGIAPLRGRLLTPADDRPDAELAALLEESFWRRRLGGDPTALGQTIRLNGKLVRVVGILPASTQNRGEIWMPLLRQPSVVEGSTFLTDWNSALDVYARLNPGVSPKASEQETRALAARLRESRPADVHAGEYLDARPVLQFEDHGNEVQVVAAAVALVLMLLLAACANLGTLVLARGVTREREIRTRLALGAGRARIVRQLFTESLLLALLSAGCALVLSSVVLKIIQLRHNPTAGVLPDWREIAATAVIAVLAAVVFGLPPALRLTSAVPRAGRARTIFLAFQVAASSLLLVVSSLLVGSLQQLGTTDQGFDYRHLVWISPGLQNHGYSQPAAQAFFDSLRARASALPGAQAASEIRLAPWGDSHMSAGCEGRQFASNRIDPQFLDTMGIRLIRGRNFRPGDDNTAIVTESTARILWPDSDPVGKPLPWDSQRITVVGVVRNASTVTVGNREPLEFYRPLTPTGARDAVLLLRVAGNPNDAVRQLQDAVRALDPRLQPNVQTLADAYDRERERVSGALAVISILGSIALLLSAIGLAGLAGYTVAQRTREIGLRMALGARATQVVRAILTPLSRPIAVGFACGALGGAAVTKILQSGISATAGMNLFDPLSYFAAMAFFTAVVALSILAPVRRAIRINPSKALQHE